MAINYEMISIEPNRTFFNWIKQIHTQKNTPNPLRQKYNFCWKTMTKKFELNFINQNQSNDASFRLCLCLCFNERKLLTNDLLCWLGVDGKGRTLSGGHRLVTETVAGNGIDVPFGPGFPYGAGSCLFWREKKKKENNIVNINCLFLWNECSFWFFTCGWRLSNSILFLSVCQLIWKLVLSFENFERKMKRKTIESVSSRFRSDVYFFVLFRWNFAHANNVAVLTNVVHVVHCMKLKALELWKYL